MVDQEDLDARRSLLAFLEVHWGELTLGEARSLSFDGLGAAGGVEAVALVKDVLMFP